MKKNIEIELKFEIQSDDNLENFLSNLEYISQKNDKDIYLDTINYNLFKKGIFIRLRNDSILDFKFNPEHFYKKDRYNIHDYCDELSFLLPLRQKDILNLNKVSQLLNLKSIISPHFDEFIESNELTNKITIDKQRKKYKDREFEYDYDIVKKLGKFIEIEYLTESKTNLQSIKKRMREKVRDLDIHEVNVGYVELYLRKYNFQTYLKGLYLLKKDFKKYKS